MKAPKPNTGQQGRCDGCGKAAWLSPLHGEEGGPLSCSKCAGAFSNKQAREALNCISDCFLTDNPVPKWAQEALINAVARAESFEIKSWDEVFGRPLEKGKQLAAKRRKSRLTKPIFERVRERHEAGEPIAKKLFESVGREFAVSSTVASEIYYEAVHDIHEAEIFNSAVKSIE